jgi:hypothetical protein
VLTPSPLSGLPAINVGACIVNCIITQAHSLQPRRALSETGRLQGPSSTSKTAILSRPIMRPASPSGCATYWIHWSLHAHMASFQLDHHQPTSYSNPNYPVLLDTQGLDRVVTALYAPHIWYGQNKVRVRKDGNIGRFDNARFAVHPPWKVHNKVPWYVAEGSSGLISKHGYFQKLFQILAKPYGEVECCMIPAVRLSFLHRAPSLSVHVIGCWSERTSLRYTVTLYCPLPHTTANYKGMTRNVELPITFCSLVISNVSSSE